MTDSILWLQFMPRKYKVYYWFFHKHNRKLIHEHCFNIQNKVSCSPQHIFHWLSAHIFTHIFMSGRRFAKFSCNVSPAFENLSLFSGFVENDRWWKWILFWKKLKLKMRLKPLENKTKILSQKSWFEGRSFPNPRLSVCLVYIDTLSQYTVQLNC